MNLQALPIGAVDVLGRHVATLAEGDVDAGLHVLRVDGGRFRPGTYVVRAQVSGVEWVQTLVQRITLVR